VIKITRLWSDVDDQDNITLFNRPRVSIKVDEYIWDLIERNIEPPAIWARRKIMVASQTDCSIIPR
jgi:hypothetical protein